MISLTVLYTIDIRRISDASILIVGPALHVAILLGVFSTHVVNNRVVIFL